ncbi:MAG: inner membrane CreD family protein [Candidatus Synoicihabitans palmerolidicus]|nr:inner membrane CreD family protein [Candidatus Synoicihabitans palmerolidicus]
MLGQSLNGTKGAMTMGLLLTGIYGGLFLVLRLEDLSLVAGTVLLFGLLGAVMYVTRHLQFEDSAQLTPTGKEVRA